MFPVELGARRARKQGGLRAGAREWASERGSEAEGEGESELASERASEAESAGARIERARARGVRFARSTRLQQ